MRIFIIIVVAAILCISLVTIGALSACVLSGRESRREEIVHKIKSDKNNKEGNK